jgi:hypothetical protein
MIQVKDPECRVAVTSAWRASAAGEVTIQRTRAGGGAVSAVPFC